MPLGRGNSNGNPQNLKPVAPGECRNKAGRPKGSENRTSKTAKANIIAVFDKIGGQKKMAEWALENPTPFYQLYGKLVVIRQQSKVDIKTTNKQAHEMTTEELERIASGSS